MARAKTIESVREAGGGGGGGGGAGGGNGPLSHHSTCRMELPRPFHTWPSSLLGPGTGTVPHHHYHHLHPSPTLCVSPGLSPSPPPPPPPPAPPALLSPQREERDGASSPHESDSDRERPRDAPGLQGPLPDLLPQNEHPSWSPPPRRAPGGEAALELEVRRVADQLRVIGDEFNATVLHRARVAPHWQDWRDACRGLLNFITQTLSTLYRLT